MFMQTIPTYKVSFYVNTDLPDGSEADDDDEIVIRVPENDLESFLKVLLFNRSGYFSVDKEDDPWTNQFIPTASKSFEDTSGS